MGLGKRFSELMKGAFAGGADPVISGVTDDSRKVRGGDLFVARSGTKKSGADFAMEAVNRGAVAVVVESGQLAVVSGQLKGRDIAMAGVENVNVTLAELAHAFADYPTRGIKMIGVTGTKGKTTVAYLLRSVLKAAGKKCGMIGTVEIDDGNSVVPADMTTPGVVELVELFSRMKANGVTHCVMEVSSHALHQGRVAGIDFAAGIFTNLTGDHLDYHKTMEDYGAAKKILFEGLKEDAVAVVNVDDAWGEKMVEGCSAKIERYCMRDWGVAPFEQAEDIKSKLDWVGEIMLMTSGGMRLQVLGRWHSELAGEKRRGRLPIKTALVGRHNVYNLLCAIAGATALEIDSHSIMRAIEDDEGVPGRLQAVVSPGNSREGMAFQVFVDYAHTHDSLENVLTAVRGTMGPGKLFCVFGCGGDRDRTKRPKMAAVAEKFADKVFVTSDNPRTEDPLAIIQEIRAGFSPNANGKVAIESDRRAAIRAAIAAAEKGDVVVIAGKGHENYQIIGTTKHHFDDVEEAEAALSERFDLTAKARRREGK